MKIFPQTNFKSLIIIIDIFLMFHAQTKKEIMLITFLKYIN